MVVHYHFVRPFIYISILGEFMNKLHAEIVVFFNVLSYAWEDLS